MVPHSVARLEFRYPFLDRDLVDFLLRVPRNQLVVPGMRRYLMRRALVGIVPEVVLNRPRKSFIARRPLANLRSARSEFNGILKGSWLVDDELITKSAFEAALSGFSAVRTPPNGLKLYAHSNSSGGSNRTTT